MTLVLTAPRMVTARVRARVWLCVSLFMCVCMCLYVCVCSRGGRIFVGVKLAGGDSTEGAIDFQVRQQAARHCKAVLTNCFHLPPTVLDAVSLLSGQRAAELAVRQQQCHHLHALNELACGSKWLQKQY